MSQPSYTLVVTTHAQTDIENILLYTLQTWGEAQQIAYAALVGRALDSIAADPRVGRTHPQLAPAYRAYHVGKHNIFYRVDGLEIIVLRLLHERMDAPRHIP